MTSPRRLVAILAADVVGYSRLMGEDEAGTALSGREHRDAARPIVAGLGGRIVKTTGDGLLLEFPSVVADGDGLPIVEGRAAGRRDVVFSRARHRQVNELGVRKRLNAGHVDFP